MLEYQERVTIMRALLFNYIIRIHPQKHQLQQQAHRHKHSTVSQHYSSLSAEDHRLRAVNYRHKDPQILQEIEQSEAPPSDAPASSSSTSNQSADDEEKAEEDGCLQQIRVSTYYITTAE